MGQSLFGGCVDYTTQVRRLRTANAETQPVKWDSLFLGAMSIIPYVNTKSIGRNRTADAFLFMWFSLLIIYSLPCARLIVISTIAPESNRRPIHVQETPLSPVFGPVSGMVGSSISSSSSTVVTVVTREVEVEGSASGMVGSSISSSSTVVG